MLEADTIPPLQTPLRRLEPAWIYQLSSQLCENYGTHLEY
jgi:hypothetical protein